MSWSHGEMRNALNICFAIFHKILYELSHNKHVMIKTWQLERVLCLAYDTCGYMICEYNLFNKENVIIFLQNISMKPAL